MHQQRQRQRQPVTKLRQLILTTIKRIGLNKLIFLIYPFALYSFLPSNLHAMQIVIRLLASQFNAN